MIRPPPNSTRTDTLFPSTTLVRSSRFNLAAALLETGDVDGALGQCSGSPRPDLARIEAYIHQQNGALDAAAKAYSRALQADPDDLASWNNQIGRAHV